MKRWISLVSATLLVIVGLTFGAGPAQADDSTCPAGNSCFWTGASFTGNKALRGAEWAGQPPQPFENLKQSVKNRFTNKTLVVYGPGHGPAFLSPNQEYPSISITSFQVL